MNDYWLREDIDNLKIKVEKIEKENTESEFWRKVMHESEIELKLEKTNHAETRIELSKAKDKISELKKENEELENENENLREWKRRHVVSSKLTWS